MLRSFVLYSAQRKLARQFGAGSGSFLFWRSLQFSLLSFVLTELVRYVLTPDLGWHPERWLAEGISSLVVGYMAARLQHAATQRHQAAIVRLRKIREMNGHIRAALDGMRLPVSAVYSQQSIRVIFERIDNIEKAVLEILPSQNESFPREDAYAG